MKVSGDHNKNTDRNRLCLAFGLGAAGIAIALATAAVDLIEGKQQQYKDMIIQIDLDELRLYERGKYSPATQAIIEGIERSQQMRREGTLPAPLPDPYGFMDFRV